MRKYIGICVLLCCVCTVMGLKPVTLHGKLAFAQNGVVRVYAYKDMLTYTRQQIQQVKVNDDGSFYLQLQVQETMPIEIAYNNTYGSMVVEPEHTYRFTLYSDSALIGRIDADMAGNYLQIRFNNIDTSELNQKIWRFNKYYNYFMNYYGDDLLKGMSKAAYDSLLGQLTGRFPNEYVPTDYYSTYVYYRYADIDLLFYAKEKDSVYQKYLTGEYVHYNNEAYMDFFHHFFENHLYGASKYIPVTMLYEDVNQKRNYFKFFDDMGSDPVLVNEVIREMVMILGLGELYDNEEFSRSNVLFLLEQLKGQTKFAQHKAMASNMIEAKTALRPGFKAPDFTLKDVYNSPVSLSDYRGKYVYLHMFATYSPASIREMLILKDMYEQYKDSLEVVSVMLDFEYSKLYHFVSEYQDFTWTFLHCSGDFSFIDAYKAYALPLGVLIDAEGRIVSYPARSLSDGLLVQIYTLFPALGEKIKH